MLRALLFDDEYIVLQGLKAMIDWSRCGVELAGTAANGIEALELFRRLRPDIVMTDIRMPGLDGLQLIEIILREAPDTICIVFSGFNEFEYVMRAMKLGVVDYLEKPVTIGKIEEALQRTMNKIGQQQEYQELKSRLEANREELLAKTTLDLLFLGGEAEDKWRQSFGSDADEVVGVTVLVFPGRPEAAPAHPSYRMVELKIGTEWVMAFFHFELPGDFLWEQLSELSAGMQETFGSGQTYGSPADAGKSFKEALRALRCGRFLEEKGWTRIEDVGETYPHPGGLSDREEAILFYMRTADKEGLLQQLEAFGQWMESERLDPEAAEQEVLKMAYVGMQSVAETAADTARMGTLSKIQHRELGGMHSRETMLLWLRRHLEAWIDWTAAARSSTRHSAVEKAQVYIESNYHRDLTLQEVADHVGMNATYFSLLFKEKTGLSYIKHVTRLRLEKAKALLRRGGRVHEVSEKVGYYKYRHFTEIFKKHYGCTPSQYRERHGCMPGQEEAQGDE
ncbi:MULTISPECIES: response regulator [unclassified Paenibacillus]|uniref:response regulator n=1 Tax=unclassified Paenibacillus TaxID=185978 RepID=UPI0009558DE7|nr:MULTISPECIES: response regulator [unclassified Paenibacillus]ASS69451.1 response regulator [Paenibacillus sp. RUD330]SIR64695.1 two-component system, response regulator YesN [Paenibacillus sp. RU4X]SIR72626.1 two-component system, response regulator YesN [Paenibacillus sp. RU4T]